MSHSPAQNKSTYWIASYPKSGNTWLRLFLENYFENPNAPLHINSLPSGSIAYLRKHFDEQLGLETADFPRQMLTDMRPRCYDLMAGAENFRFVKTHECFTRTSTGEPVFSDRTSAGAILVVRHPYDVAISMSHFLSMTIEDTITRMSGLARSDENAFTEVIPHETGSWSSFARSWLDGSLPLHVIRYEDMLEHPEDAFAGVLNFLKEPPDKARLQKSIAFTSFDELKRQEAETGFAAMQTGAESFFREGRKDNWQDQLSSGQHQRLRREHAGMMKRLLYRP